MYIPRQLSVHHDTRIDESISLVPGQAVRALCQLDRSGQFAAGLSLTLSITPASLCHCWPFAITLRVFFSTAIAPTFYTPFYGIILRYSIPISMRDRMFLPLHSCTECTIIFDLFRHNDIAKGPRGRSHLWFIHAQIVQDIEPCHMLESKFLCHQMSFINCLPSVMWRVFATAYLTNKIVYF